MEFLIAIWEHQLIKDGSIHKLDAVQQEMFDVVVCFPNFRFTSVGFVFLLAFSSQWNSFGFNLMKNTNSQFQLIFKTSVFLQL